MQQLHSLSNLQSVRALLEQRDRRQDLQSNRSKAQAGDTNQWRAGQALEVHQRGQVPVCVHGHSDIHSQSHEHAVSGRAAADQKANRRGHKSVRGAEYQFEQKRLR